MRCSLNAGSVHSPAWKRLLLTGTLLAACICSASSELPSSASSDFLTEGANARLSVPNNFDGILSTSWFRGHEARPEAMVFSPEGLPGPSHTGREMLGTQGSLVIRNVTVQDSGNYTVVLETKRGRRTVTEEIRVDDNPMLVLTFPETRQGVIRSELNYSVILQCLCAVIPEPRLYWTFNGELRGTGEMLIIRRLSMEDLGVYVCVAKGDQLEFSSQPLNISLPQIIVDDEPFEPDPPTLLLSGGSAIALLLTGNMGFVILLGGIVSTIIRTQRSDRQRIRICS